MQRFVQTWLAPKSKRLRFLAIALVASVFAAVALFGHPAHAGAFGLPSNPLSDLDPNPLDQLTSLSNGWWATGKSIGNYLFSTLMIIEIVLFGVQMALFRDNLGEFFGGLALKIVGLGFFFWLLDQSDTIFPAIKNSLDSAGTQIVGHDETSDIASVLLNCGIGIAGLFVVAGIQHAADEAAATAGGASFLGTGDDGLPIAAVNGHFMDIAIEQFIAYLMLTAIVIVILQYIIVNAEAFLVLAGGVLFLGFAGSKFTLPFAQGYMGYAINVGAKLLALHLGLAAAAVLSGKIVAAMGVSLIALGSEGAIPGGIGDEVVIGTLAYAAFQTVMMAAMVWMIPNLAGAFLSGQSSSSGTQVLSNAAGAAAGSASLAANLDANRLDASKAHGGHGGGGGGGESSGKPVSAPGQSGDSASGTPPNTSLSGSTMQGGGDGGSSGGGANQAALASPSNAGPMTSGSSTNLGNFYQATASKGGGGGGQTPGAPLQAGAGAPVDSGGPASGGGAPPTSDTAPAVSPAAAGSLAASALPPSSGAPPSAISATAASSGSSPAGAPPSAGRQGAARQGGAGSPPPSHSQSLNQDGENAQIMGGGQQQGRTGDPTIDAERDMAYALSGLAQGIPHENAPASAVQVRLGLPEKI